MFVMSAHFIGASSVKSNIVFTKTNYGQAPTSKTMKGKKMEIDTKELFNNEQFIYALADALAEKMFNNKVYEQFFDDWTTEFAKMVKENIDKK